MIRVERDPALPPGKAEALDRDGKVLATITLPHDRVPSGTATVRIGGDVFDGVVEVLEDIARD
jgi:hypothetical protein